MTRTNLTGGVLATTFATLCCLTVVSPARAATWLQQAELVPGDGDVGDRYGGSVSIDSQGGVPRSPEAFNVTAIVGAWEDDDISTGVNSGSVYIWKDSGSGWNAVDKVLPYDHSDHHEFGVGVSISNHKALVGAPGLREFPGGKVRGVAYTLEWNVREPNDWVLRDVVFPDRPGSPWIIPRMGNSVSINAIGRAVVGAQTWLGNVGVTVYYQDVIDDPLPASGPDWLLAADAHVDDYFGASVSIANSADPRIVVGAPWHAHEGGPASGAAYIFEKGSLGWQQEELAPDGIGEDDDTFGLSVAIHGDIAIVGAPYDRNSAGKRTGAAYIFTGGHLDQSGSQWTQVAKLQPYGLQEEDEFGLSVSISGGTVIVGAPNDRNSAGESTGAAYVFVRTPSGSWPQTDKLLPDDGQPGDNFGGSVSISRDEAIVGALTHATENGFESGSAYTFRRSKFYSIGPAIDTWVEWGGGSYVAGGVHANFPEVTHGGTYGGDFFWPDNQEGLEEAIGVGAARLVDFDFASDPFQVWEINFDGQFTREATLWFGYDEMGLRVPEEWLRMRQYVDGEWVLPQQTLHPDDNMVMVTVDSFGPFALSVVPEPSTLVLLAAGGLCLLLWRRRGRRRSAA